MCVCTTHDGRIISRDVKDLKKVLSEYTTKGSFALCVDMVRGSTSLLREARLMGYSLQTEGSRLPGIKMEGYMSLIMSLGG